MLSKLRVRDFTRLKHASNLDLIALVQEVPGAVDIGLQVVIRNTRTNLYTLYLLLRFLFVLAELAFEVFVPTEVNDFAHRRVGIGGDHYQVQALFAGERQSRTALNYAKLGAISIDDSNLAKTKDAFVYGGARIGAFVVSSKSCYLCVPFGCVMQPRK